ncbi:MAG: hypothetical protein KC656_32645, partial [Myxococcales bacterium]|nr:hypothetical protein [Myxococcales bacterium]
LEQLFVDATGTVYRASCGVGGTLGHVGAAELRLPDAPVRCTRQRCGCATDISVTKYPARHRRTVLAARP